MSSKSTNIVFDRRIEGRQSSVKIKHERGKLLQKLRRQIGSAIADYNMIEEGDRVLVCMSGGKDSYTLLDILEKLRKKAPVNFELLAFHLDQRQPGYPAGVLSFIPRRARPLFLRTTSLWGMLFCMGQPGGRHSSAVGRLSDLRYAIVGPVP